MKTQNLLKMKCIKYIESDTIKQSPLLLYLPNNDQNITATFIIDLLRNLQKKLLTSFEFNSKSNFISSDFKNICFTYLLIDAWFNQNIDENNLSISKKRFTLLLAEFFDQSKTIYDLL